MKLSESSLLLADEVRAVCAEQGVELLLIGALALAAHGYPRHTEDIDFAIAVAPSRLPQLALSLKGLGVDVLVSDPDPSDPLGGVITLRRAKSAPIQLVNFDNPPAGGFPRLVHEALERASTPEGGLGKLPTVEDLLLFKLYAGGPKSQLDILELLTRTRVDLGILRERAREYRMEGELAALLKIAGLEKAP